MNKSEFVKELSKETGYNEEKSALVNDVLENHFIFGRKNKEKIIQDLKEKIGLSEEEAENTYNISMKIIGTEIKDKTKHPFKSKE